jgi:hypothetical protein
MMTPSTINVNPAHHNERCTNATTCDGDGVLSAMMVGV